MRPRMNKTELAMVHGLTHESGHREPTTRIQKPEQMPQIRHFFTNKKSDPCDNTWYI